MSDIELVHARQILDSRGNPTVEVDLVLRSGAAGRAILGFHDDLKDAPPGARPSRRARRPASSRPSSCATGETPGAGRGSRRPSTT